MYHNSPTSASPPQTTQSVSPAKPDRLVRGDPPPPSTSITFAPTAKPRMRLRNTLRNTADVEKASSQYGLKFCTSRLIFMPIWRWRPPFIYLFIGIYGNLNASHSINDQSHKLSDQTCCISISLRTAFLPVFWPDSLEWHTGSLAVLVLLFNSQWL